jgi:hypothetical protein
MTNGTKICIGVGALAIIGVAVWYFGFRKK